VRAFHLANLALQLAIALVVARAFYLARKRRLKPHCLTMRVAVGLEVAAVIFAMLSPYAAYLRNPPNSGLLFPEIVLHHSLGLVVVLAFVYVNLVYQGVLHYPRTLKPVMRTALIVWAVSLALGVHLFFRVWG
jgi:hypothetical protein